jgi:hypothetical protein
MLENRKVLLERLEKNEQTLNAVIAKLENQLAVSEARLKGKLREGQVR